MNPEEMLALLRLLARLSIAIDSLERKPREQKEQTED